MIKITRFISSLAYVGYLPKMPGTYASAITVIIIYQFQLNHSINLILLTLTLGIILSSHVEKYDGKDPAHVVIDEFVGALIAFYMIDINLFNLIVGFALFRYFDIAKPLGIRYSQSLYAGFGVMIDDVIAGIYTNGFINLINYVWKSYG